MLSKTDPARIFLFLTILMVGLLSGFAEQVPAEDSPFDGPSNWGGTGLLEIPTARVIEDGALRFGFAQADPLRWYSIGMGVFPGLEFSGRLVELSGIKGDIFKNLKTRAIDVKYQIFPESKRFPAVAIGLQDPIGTRVFPAEYLVLSRQLFPLDFSLGIGRNRLGGNLKVPFLGDLGLFGGIELALTPWIHLTAEYSPIQYEEDRNRYQRVILEKADSPFNVGVKVKVFSGATVGVSYQRGNTLGFMVHLGVDLGNAIMPHRVDPPAWTPADTPPHILRDTKKMIGAVNDALQEAGFSDIRVYTDGRELIGEFSNNRYLSDIKAVGRVLRILLFNSPPGIEKIAAVVCRRDQPFLKASVHPEDFKKFLFNEIPERVFAGLITFEITSADAQKEQTAVIRTALTKKATYNFGIKPEIQTYLLDEKQYVQVRPGIKPYMIVSLWKGASFYARYDIPFYSDVDSSVIPPSDAVRSDAATYLGLDYSFDYLMIDQTLRLGEKTFGRLSGGYLEKMYAGIGGEVLSFLKDGKWALGIEGNWALKRTPGAQLGIEDKAVYSFFGHVYRQIPEFGMTLSAKFGRFLYGDRGIRFEARREFDTGVTIGTWYTITDTDQFSGYNKGYNDKGVFLSIPIRMFLSHDSPTRYTYVFSPWTRDVGADIFHWQTLYDLGQELTPSDFKYNLKKIKE